MSGKKIALTFSVFFGIGAALFALVWRMKGTFPAIVGVVAALFVIGDSLAVLVGKGSLGFEVILQFGAGQAAGQYKHD